MARESHYDYCYLKNGCDDTPTEEAPDSWKSNQNISLKIRYKEADAFGVMQPVFSNTPFEIDDRNYQKSKCVAASLAKKSKLKEIFEKYGGVNQLRWIYLQTDYGQFVVYPEVSMLRQFDSYGLSPPRKACITRDLKRNFVIQSILARKMNIYLVDMNKGITNQAYIQDLMERRLDFSSVDEYFAVIAITNPSKVLIQPSRMDGQNITRAKDMIRSALFSERNGYSDFQGAFDLAYRILERSMNQSFRLCSHNIVVVSDGKDFSKNLNINEVNRKLEKFRKESNLKVALYTFQIGETIDIQFRSIVCRNFGVSWNSKDTFIESQIKNLYASAMYDPNTKKSAQPKWSSELEDLLGLGMVYTVSLLCTKEKYGYNAVVGADIQLSQIQNTSILERYHKETVSSFCPDLSDTRREIILKEARKLQGEDYCDGINPNLMPLLFTFTHIFTFIIGLILGGISLEIGIRCWKKRNEIQIQRKYQTIE